VVVNVEQVSRTVVPIVRLGGRRHEVVEHVYCVCEGGLALARVCRQRAQHGSVLPRHVRHRAPRVAHRYQVSPLCPGGQDAVACAPGAVFGQRKPTLPAGKRSSQTSLPGAMGSSVLSLAQLNPRAPCTRPAPARHPSLHGLTLLTVKVDGTKRISGGLSTVSLNALQRLLPASSAAQDHFPLSNLSASVTPSTDIRRPSASSDTVRVQMSLKPDFSLNVVLTYLVVPLKFILTLSLYHVKAMFGDPYAIQ
ncbi:hypothetical protein HW555_013157, partial [Spodoptera exigua]